MTRPSTVRNPSAVSRRFAVVRGRDFEQHRHLLVGRHHLPAVHPRVRPVEGHRLPAAGRGVAPALPGRVLEQLQERLQPERPGPHRVLVEVGLEEPEARIDGDPPRHQPEALARRRPAGSRRSGPPSAASGPGTAASCGSSPRSAASLRPSATAPSRRGMPDLVRQRRLARRSRSTSCPRTPRPPRSRTSIVVVLDDHPRRLRHAGHLRRSWSACRCRASRPGTASPCRRGCGTTGRVGLVRAEPQ